MIGYCKPQLFYIKVRFSGVYLGSSDVKSRRLVISRRDEADPVYFVFAYLLIQLLKVDDCFLLTNRDLQLGFLSLCWVCLLEFS